MKLLLHPQRLPDNHHHHGKPSPNQQHTKASSKKSHKIMKKMAKLEKKLSKYNFDSSSSEDSCLSDNAAANERSRSLSKSHKQRKGRSRKQRGRRFASRGRCSSSSSSSSSSSDSGDSKSSSSSATSSRSPSPCERRFHRHHRHGSPAHLSRSKSFAGRADRSPSPRSRGHHHHHRQHPPHHRGRFWHHQCRRLQDGLRGYFSMMSTEDQPNSRAAAAEAPTAPDFMDLVARSRSVSRERGGRLYPSLPVEVADDIEVVEPDAAENGSDGAPELDQALADNWKKIIREGLPSEAKSALLNKYSTSKNCILRGPKLNGELLPVAAETSVKNDSVLMHQQKQLGSGLTALGKAITDLNNKTDLKDDKEVHGILEELNDAAVIIVDAHRNITKQRQALMQSELKRRVRHVVDNCEHDELLYGKDFGKKIENLKGFGKYKKGSKKHEREGRHHGKGEKRKQPDQDNEGRRSKCLSTSQIEPK